MGRTPVKKVMSKFASRNVLSFEKKHLQSDSFFKGSEGDSKSNSICNDFMILEVQENSSIMNIKSKEVLSKYSEIDSSFSKSLKDGNVIVSN